ncbi:MAG: hypothetical protein AB7K52_07985 [Phycisphaerales bacterium]
MPRTPEELHAWLREHLGVLAPRAALLESSTAPFDYLCHAFFEGRAGGFECAGAVGTRRDAPDSQAVGGADIRRESSDQPCGLDSENPGAPVAPPRHPDCVVWANRGGGKTFLGAVATLLDLCWKPGIEVRILGGSLEQSRRMYEHLREFFERDAFRGLVRRPRGRVTSREIRLHTGSRVQILAQSEAAVRGTRVQKLRCDELDLFDPEIWRAAQLTTRSIQCGAPWSGWVRGSIEALSTMHRPLGLMWEVVGSARRAEERAEEQHTAARPPTRVLFRWGIVDVLESCPPARQCATCVLNPECAGRAKERPPGRAGHITIDDAVHQKSRVSRAAWDAEMLCLRPFRGHAVLPEFDPVVHVFTPAPDERSAADAIAQAARRGAAEAPRDIESLAADRIEHERRPSSARAAIGTLLCGIDFGFRAPTVILWVRRMADGVLRVIAERSVVQTRLDEHIQAILTSPLGVPEWVGVDPAGGQHDLQTGQSCVEVLRKAGLVVHARRLGLHEGLNLIRARLAPATMRTHAQREGASESPESAGQAPHDPGENSGADALPSIGSTPTLYVSSMCTTLIESLTRYHYDESHPERIEPVKDGSDHAVDALRYLVAALDRPHRTDRRDY